MNPEYPPMYGVLWSDREVTEVGLSFKDAIDAITTAKRNCAAWGGDTPGLVPLRLVRITDGGWEYLRPTREELLGLYASEAQR